MGVALTQVATFSEHVHVLTRQEASATRPQSTLQRRATEKPTRLHQNLSTASAGAVRRILLDINCCILMHKILSLMTCRGRTRCTTRGRRVRWRRRFCSRCWRLIPPASRSRQSSDPPPHFLDVFCPTPGCVSSQPRLFHQRQRAQLRILMRATVLHCPLGSTGDSLIYPAAALRVSC